MKDPTTMMPITKVPLNLSEGYEAQKALKKLCTQNDFSIMIDYRAGLRDDTIEPCFFCGELPKFVWSKRGKEIRFHCKHKHNYKPGYVMPPGSKYACSNLTTGFDSDEGLLRLRWNERQRQLRATAAYAAAHPEIYK